MKEKLLGDIHMRIVGLIAEYNPFHNGHQYHIEEAKALTHADAVVVIMSGDFVQRGCPAIMPKHMRAELALKCGANLVLELPVCYATGTAEQFAYGAVSMLHNLGCIDAICFGSECGDIDALKELASILADETLEYKTLLQDLLRLGLSYPAARQQAIATIYPNKNFAQLLDEPNNILGIEYLKAIYRLSSKMIPCTIKRNTSHYHDEELQEEFSSASAIRNALSEVHFDALKSQMPAVCYDTLYSAYRFRFPIYANDFSLLLKYRLLSENKISLTTYADVSEDLANRIMNNLNQFINFEQFCDFIKTKEITRSRISRALIHILLNVKKEDYDDITYARILGFTTEKSELLSMMKKQSQLTLISKLPSEIDCKMLENDMFASNLYESVITEKFETPFINEYKHPIVRI